MKSSTLFVLIVALLVVIGGWYWYSNGPANDTPAGTATSTSSTHNVSFFCTEGTLAVAFGSTTAAVTFPNGRQLTMTHATSADGARYEADGTVFWNKGENAFVTENGSSTYSNCVAGVVTSQGGTNIFSDATGLFSFAYPSQLTLSGGDGSYTQSWMQNATTSGMLLAKVTVPASYQPKTNFLDSSFTVGVSSDPSAVSSCLTQKNGNVAATTQVDINGTSFAEIQYGDAGAGNLYETTSYRTVKDNECYAVEYTIHSGNIHNYPAGKVTAFNHAAVQQLFEGIARSFKFLQ